MMKLQWELTVDAVVGFNRKVIEDAHRKDPICQHKHCLVRPSDLASCLGSIFYQDYRGSFLNAPLEKMAGLILYRIAQGQFFIDGNKRTAVVSATFFLRNNGHALRIERDVVRGLLYGFAADNTKTMAGPAKTEDDAISFIYDNILPNLVP